jgi:hypothetical protein
LISSLSSMFVNCLLSISLPAACPWSLADREHTMLCWLSKTVPYPANLLVWALWVHIHQHSAVQQPEDLFLWCLHSPELKEFPRSLERKSNFDFLDPVCNFKCDFSKTGCIKHLASFLCWWDYPGMIASIMTRLSSIIMYWTFTYKQELMVLLLLENVGITSH